MTSLSKLESLPVEIKLKIISYSTNTFNELTAARAISQHFKALIEKQENRGQLLRRLQDAKAAELTAYIKYYVNYGPSLTFLEALGRFMEHRRHEFYRPVSEDILDLFCINWELQTERSGKDRDEWIDLAFELWDLHTHFHTLRRSAADLTAERFCSQALTIANAGVLGFDEKKLHETYLIVKDTPGGVMPMRGTGFEDWSSWMTPGSKMWPISGEMRDWSVSGHLRDRYRQLYCTAEVAKMLHIPDIPGKAFGFCVKSEAMHGLVKMAADAGRDLNAVERLQVLEELFVY